MCCVGQLGRAGGVLQAYQWLFRLCCLWARFSFLYALLDLKPYYEQTYSPVFQSCLKSADHADTSPFSFVAAIGKDGHVLRLYVDRETNIYACVRQTLQQDEFPHPPISPYYFHVSMSFSK